MSVLFRDGLPMADYLSTPAVSASDMIAMDQECPANAWAYCAMNPKREPREDTEATLLGTAAHMAIIQPDEFAARYVVRPDDINPRKKAGHAWRDEQEAAGREILSADAAGAINAIAGAVRRHKLAARALSAGKAEVTMTWTDEETGLPCKARPDWLHASRNAYDLKTAISAAPTRFETQASKLAYYMRAAWALDALRLGDPDATYAFVAVEKSPPYPVIVAAYNEEAIEWARIQNRAALRRFAECMSAGRWPGYADDRVIELGLPPWAERALQRRHEQGAFSPPAPKTETRDVTMAGD